MKKKAIILAKELPLIEIQKIKKDPEYHYFVATHTFVFKSKMKEIKELLDLKHSITEINEMITC
ncbi:MAG: hypothetical protein RLZZ86_2910 [Cyanobacteriota bacterium]|jgi:hypothetical protein